MRHSTLRCRLASRMDAVIGHTYPVSVVRYSLAWAVCVVSAVGLACGTSSAARSAQDPDRPTLAITAVHVVEMTGAPVRPGLTVLVTGSRISWIGPSSTVDIPADVPRLEGRGRWLIPGLWDMHAHTPLPDRDLALSLANGLTGIRDMGGEVTGNPAKAPAGFSIGWATLGPIRDDIGGGRRRSPRIVAAGMMLDAPTPWPGTLAVVDAADARRVVRRLRDERVDFVKIGTGVTPEVHAATVAEARRIGLPVAGHVPRGMTALAVAEAGQVIVEHLMGLPASCFADDGPDAACRATLRQLAATGV